jgi:hypothetical protein
MLFSKSIFRKAVSFALCVCAVLALLPSEPAAAIQQVPQDAEYKKSGIFEYYIDSSGAHILDLNTSEKKIKVPRSITDNGVSYPVVEFLLQYENPKHDSVKELDFSGCTEVRFIRIEFTKLASINVSGCKKLEELECWYNEITFLDARNCTSLKMLCCYNNMLQTLDVAGCTSLTILYCHNNLLTSIDLRDTDLNSPDSDICCYRNFFKSTDDLIGLTTVREMFTYFRLNYYLQLDEKYFPLRKFTDIGWQNIYTEHYDWYIEYILFAVNRKLFFGVSDTEFAPNTPMTRGMLVTVMQHYADVPNTAADSRFTDVTADAWYAGAVAWAAKNGIVAGVSSTEFAPNANVTREQFASVLYRYALAYLKMDVSKTAELKFDDKNDISDYALTAIKWCVANGIIEGKDGNIVDPQGSATRAEVATMIYHFDKLVNPQP